MCCTANKSRKCKLYDKIIITLHPLDGKDLCLAHTYSLNKLPSRNYPYRIALRFCASSFDSPSSSVPWIASTGKGPLMFGFQNILLFVFVPAPDSPRDAYRRLALRTPDCSKVGSPTRWRISRSFLHRWSVMSESHTMLLKTPALLGSQQIIHATSRKQILDERIV